LLRIKANLHATFALFLIVGPIISSSAVFTDGTSFIATD